MGVLKHCGCKVRPVYRAGRNIAGLANGPGEVDINRLCRDKNWRYERNSSTWERGLRTLSYLRVIGAGAVGHACCVGNGENSKRSYVKGRNRSKIYGKVV